MSQPDNDTPSSPPQQRPETGPMRFGDDWPGVFLRGDAAFGFAVSLSRVVELIDRMPDTEGASDANFLKMHAALHLRRLQGLLASSDVREGTTVANALRPFEACDARAESPDHAEVARLRAEFDALRRVADAALVDNARLSTQHDACLGEPRRQSDGTEPTS